jgi:hypothetical protein
VIVFGLLLKWYTRTLKSLMRKLITLVGMKQSTSRWNRIVSKRNSRNLPLWLVWSIHPANDSLKISSIWLSIVKDEVKKILGSWVWCNLCVGLSGVSRADPQSGVDCSGASIFIFNFKFINRVVLLQSVMYTMLREYCTIKCFHTYYVPW